MSHIEIDSSGTIRWYDEKGQIHRDNDLPAIVRSNGTQEWWVKHKMHREGDLPAFIGSQGARIWCKNNTRHRDNGLPAVTEPNGYKEYWHYGERYK